MLKTRRWSERLRWSRCNSSKTPVMWRGSWQNSQKTKWSKSIMKTKRLQDSKTISSSNLSNYPPMKKSFRQTYKPRENPSSKDWRPLNTLKNNYKQKLSNFKSCFLRKSKCWSKLRPKSTPQQNKLRKFRRLLERKELN